MGWYYDKELTKLWDFDTMTVEKDTVLYAKWAVTVVEEPKDDVIIEDEEEIEPEEEETESRVPELLEGDDHEYPANTNSEEGASMLPVILCIAGGVVLVASGLLVWLFVARKRRKN